MSFAPLRTSPRRRRRVLNREQVVGAALDLLDAEGLDALTMRRLAQRLGVQAASLYRHVRNKDELLAWLGDAISAGIPLVEPTGTWQEQLRAMAWNARRGLLAHRDGARVLAGSRPAGPRRLQRIEAVLRVLRSAGLNPRDAARAAHHLNNFVTEFAADEARFATFAAANGGRRKMFAEVRRAFAALPRADYPTLAELAGPLTEDKPEELFAFGVEMCVRGIAALADRPLRNS